MVQADAIHQMGIRGVIEYRWAVSTPKPGLKRGETVALQRFNQALELPL